MASKKQQLTDDQLLVKLLLKKIGPVDPDDVIAADLHPLQGKQKYIIKLGGKRVSDTEALSLQKEVEHLRHMRIYTLFTETLRYQAERRMFKDFDASNGEIYNAGKYLLHAISTLEHIVWSCENPLLLAEQKAINTPARKGMDKRRLLTDNVKT